MKRKLSVMVLLFVLVVGGMVYAQSNQGPETPGLAERELTAEQRAELEANWDQTGDVRQQMLDKLVEFGVTSPKRAQWIQEGWELQQEEGFNHHGIFGRDYGPCHGANYRNRGFNRRF